MRSVHFTDTNSCVGNETKKAGLLDVLSISLSIDTDKDRRKLYAAKLSYFHSCMEAVVGGRCACVESDKGKCFQQII